MGTFKDLTGQKFGRLTVVKQAEHYITPKGKKRIRWECLCDCGKTTYVVADALTRGIQVSCGCYRNSQLSKMSTTHEKTNTRLYTVWNGMKNRCYNTRCPEYRIYGGRGIHMCSDWHYDFQKFYDWAIENGYDETAPRGKQTVDRIDCNGEYSPENCRLTTQREQMNNIRNNHNLEYRGETHSIAELSRITGIRQEKIRNRVSKLGWTAERALTTI